MSFGFLVAGFLATTNAGRVSLAARVAHPGRRAVMAALLVSSGVVTAAVVFAGDLLDGLSISPESFRIAAGLVLGATGVKTIVWPRPMQGPFAAVLVTPELVALAISFGADETTARAMAAAAVSIPFVTWAALRPPRQATGTVAAQFLAALQLVVAVALVVSGVRDV